MVLFIVFVEPRSRQPGTGAPESTSDAADNLNVIVDVLYNSGRTLTKRAKWLGFAAIGGQNHAGILLTRIMPRLQVGTQNYSNIRIRIAWRVSRQFNFSTEPTRAVNRMKRHARSHLSLEPRCKWGRLAHSAPHRLGNRRCL